ncbi:MAG: ImmA/IrrE family metallo-endopeptidase [Bacteroidetes bacterium]|nr:ImmA/IrrE family metallo-endopeptidase [Bacteroidota bacterium]
MMNEIYRMLGTSDTKKLADIIHARISELGIPNMHLAKILNIPRSTFDRTLKQIEEGVIDGLAFFDILKICQFFNISVEDIAKIYVSSLKPENVSQLEIAKKANFLYRKFDLKGLKDIGFISSLTDIVAIEKRFLTFFNLNSLYDYEEEVGGVLYSKTKKKSAADEMKEMWVKCAILQFQKVNNTNEYDKEKLLALIPKIRPYTRYEEKGFLTVIQALYNIGITVIVQRYLAKTQVRGATFVVDEKPCIVITDFNKSYPTLWFALMHELYHVLYDLDALKTWKFHTSGEEEGTTKQIESDLFNEDYADYFAREMLFPKEKLEFIKQHINTPSLVDQYAKEHAIHPSLIYAFYVFDENLQGRSKFANYQKYFTSSDKALKVVKTNPWDKASIYEEIEKIKAILTT